MKQYLMMLMISVAVFTSTRLLAQEKAYVISGRVSSFEESLALEGVSIYVKGTNNNTGTQADGSFSLEIMPGNKVLVVELTKYERQEIAITGQQQYDIVLKRGGTQVQVKTVAAKTCLARTGTRIPGYNPVN